MGAQAHFGVPERFNDLRDSLPARGDTKPEYSARSSGFSQWILVVQVCHGGGGTTVYLLQRQCGFRLRQFTRRQMICNRLYQFLCSGNCYITKQDAHFSRAVDYGSGVHGSHDRGSRGGASSDGVGGARILSRATHGHQRR